MPYGNGTGPNGFGPMTGRGQGVCAGNNAAGCYSAGRGLGLGRGRGGHGRGCGMGRRFGMSYRADAPMTALAAPVQPLTSDEELTGIDNAVAALKRQLDALETRASALRGKKE